MRRARCGARLRPHAATSSWQAGSDGAGGGVVLGVWWAWAGAACLAPAPCMPSAASSPSLVPAAAAAALPPQARNAHAADAGSPVHPLRLVADLQVGGWMGIGALGRLLRVYRRALAARAPLAPRARLAGNRQPRRAPSPSGGLAVAAGPPRRRDLLHLSGHGVAPHLLRPLPAGDNGCRVLDCRRRCAVLPRRCCAACWPAAAPTRRPKTSCPCPCPRPCPRPRPCLACLQVHRPRQVCISNGQQTMGVSMPWAMSAAFDARDPGR